MKKAKNSNQKAQAKVDLQSYSQSENMFYTKEEICKMIEDFEGEINRLTADMSFLKESSKKTRSISKKSRAKY